MADLYGPIQSRIDTAANWSSNNPVLLLGEQGIAQDASGEGVKFGDGATAWNDKAFGPNIIGRFAGGGVITATVQKGAFAVGYAFDAGEITATAYGSLAGGWAYGPGAGPGSTLIRAGNVGAFAHGTAYVYNFASVGYAKLEASGRGSHVLGYVYSYADGKASLSASGIGSMAMGYVFGSSPSYVSSISAQTRGTFAGGYAVDATILANADGAFQWGPGTNSVEQSLAVGGALRLNGSTGTPAVLRNGDQWEAGGYVYIRSGGVSVKIT